jgi:hypothetical protein
MIDRIMQATRTADAVDMQAQHAALAVCSLVKHDAVCIDLLLLPLLLLPSPIRCKMSSPSSTLPNTTCLPAAQQTASTSSMV